ETRLSSKLSEVNDEVTAVLYEPVRGEDGRVVIERGTEFFGRVTQVQAAKRPQKEASMTVVFDTMRMPYGTEKVSVTIVAIDDYANDAKLKSKNDEGKVGGGHSGGSTARKAGIGGRVGTPGGKIGGEGGGPTGGRHRGWSARRRACDQRQRHQTRARHDPEDQIRTRGHAPGL